MLANQKTYIQFSMKITNQKQIAEINTFILRTKSAKIVVNKYKIDLMFVFNDRNIYVKKVYKSR